MSPRAEANGVRGPPMSAECATRRKTESGRACADRNEGKSERLPGERESKEDGYNVRRVSKRIVGGDRVRASLSRRRSQRTVFGPRPASKLQGKEGRNSTVNERDGEDDRGGGLEKERDRERQGKGSSSWNAARRAVLVLACLCRVSSAQRSHYDREPLGDAR